jgi:hypothetical protein
VNLWQRFLHAVRPLQQITLVDIGQQMGPHKVDWLAAQKRKALGRAYLCHPANWITSPEQRDRQERTAAAVRQLNQTGRGLRVVDIRRSK